MKTIPELYDEVVANEVLKAAFMEAAEAGNMEGFLAEHECNASLDELIAFLKAIDEEDDPLTMDDLKYCRGGTPKEDITTLIYALYRKNNGWTRKPGR